MKLFHNYLDLRRMKIISATVEDIDKVASLFSDYRHFYRKERDPKAEKEFLTQRLENKESVIFLCEDDAELIGFVQLYPLFSSTRLSRLWLLNDLYVHSSHRNKGIGKLLMDRAKQLAIETNACGISLETEKSNDPGNHLYPKEGFELDSEHNFYFWENK